MCILHSPLGRSYLNEASITGPISVSVSGSGLESDISKEPVSCSKIVPSLPIIFNV